MRTSQIAWAIAVSLLMWLALGVIVWRSIA